MQHEIPNVDLNPAAHAIALQARTLRLGDRVRSSPRQPEVVPPGRNNRTRNFVCENKHASYDPRGNNLAGRQLACSVAG